MTYTISTNNNDEENGLLGVLLNIDERLSYISYSLRCTNRDYNTVQRLTYAALYLNKFRALQVFSEHLASAERKELPAIAYIFQKAYGRELNQSATEAWDKLPARKREKIKHSVREAVVLIEGEEAIDLPLSPFALDIVGLPANEEGWESYDTSQPKLNELADGAPCKGLSRTVGRAVYSVIKDRTAGNLFRAIRLPSWRLNDNRSALWDVTDGYIEALAAYVDQREKSKLGPLTRDELFTAVDDLVKKVSSMSVPLSLRAADKLTQRYKFTASEFVANASFHKRLRLSWKCYPFGACVAGALDFDVDQDEKDPNVLSEWTFGYLARHCIPYASLTNVEKDDPIAFLEVQLDDALGLHDEIEVYIYFYRIFNRFRGCQYTNPADPSAPPIDVCKNYPKNKYPKLPSYESVREWREKQRLAIADNLF